MTKTAPFTVRIPGHTCWAEGFGVLADALAERDYANRAVAPGHVVIDADLNVCDIIDDTDPLADEATS